MASIPKVKLITYQEYRSFEADDNFIYELLNGRLVKKSAPSPNHQRISGILFRKISNFIDSKTLGSCFYSPIDVFLDDNNAPQPDLVYISNQKKELITNDGIMGPPDLVVEIISPSSVVRDRVEKMKLYEKYGIPEYWVIDPQYKSVEIYLIGEDKAYQIKEHAIEQGKVSSKILTGFELELSSLFS